MNATNISCSVKYSHCMYSLDTLDDICQYPTASHLDEYVLNTKGKIWVGSDCSKVGNAWQYAQFNKDTLEVALWIMDHMKVIDRGDPILVSTRHFYSHPWE